MYYNSTFTVVESDHNNVHPGNGNWGYFNANQATLGDFQSATGMDVNSISVDPQFVSDIDLHTCADSLDAAGAHVSSVTDDYDGQARDMSTPDIGADEFLGLANFGFQSDSLWKCSGDALVLGGWEPTDDATYLWSTTETTPTISVTNPGSYDVLATTGCGTCLLYTSPSPRDQRGSRMPSSA